jgi:hypothetical protein
MEGLLHGDGLADRSRAFAEPRPRRVDQYFQPEGLSHERLRSKFVLSLAREFYVLAPLDGEAILSIRSVHMHR